MEIRLALAADADSVAGLVFDLLEELAAPAPSGFELATVAATARVLLGSGAHVWALLAEDAGRAIGVLTLNECASIYAGGRFGEICELYVIPAFRRSGVGRLLLQSAVELAGRRGWSRLEVGAPDVPRWARTVAFYREAGFEEIGPRLKLPLRSAPA